MTAAGTAAGTSRAGRDELVTLARVVFPTEGDLDVLPLHVDGEHVPEPPEGGAPVLTMPSTIHPDQVLGRRTFRVDAGQRVSFATYLNALPASYWRRFTTVESVELRLRTTGEGNVLVYRSTARASAIRVTAQTVEGTDTETRITLPLKAFVDGGWLWFDLVAGREPLVLEEADWLGQARRLTTPGSPGTGTATIGITTFNRPDYCNVLLAQLASDELHGVIDRVVVVDQGTDRVVDDSAYETAADALGERLRVVEQANLGGSGGFSRAMIETLDAGESDHVMLLDDDVVCEPEGIRRAVTFASVARQPTIVGGHMFSMYDRAVLHAFSEVVLPWQFRWAPAAPSVHDHDLSTLGLRSTPWLHRRIHADYTGWWMCVIPVAVLREVGLSMPFFIKWDDAEYGLRAAASGVPTVSLPGAAVWHVPWTDKDDAVDWQAYFHARNRMVAALVHSAYDHGGRMVRESLAISLKHILSMQYSAARLRLEALRDVLDGPERLHAQLGTRLGDVRALRRGYTDAEVRADPDDLPPVRPKRRRRREGSVAGKVPGTLGTMLVAGSGLVRQLRAVPDRARAHPDREVAGPDATWWRLAELDSALVTGADGTGLAWYRRDRGAAGQAIRDAVAVHRRLLLEWPQLSARYQAQLDALVGQAAWRDTLGLRTPHTEPAVAPLPAARTGAEPGSAG